MLQAENIINKYYAQSVKARDILITHSRKVRDKAMWIANKNQHLNVNLEMLELGAMLHDIGVLYTNAPEIGCYGSYQYVCHGYLGRELLEKEGLKDIALFAERHTGTGLSFEMIKSQNLPLPQRDMMPVTIEEQILCFTDKFYSKGKHPETEIPIEKIRAKLSNHGADQLERFNNWCDFFL